MKFYFGKITIFNIYIKHKIFLFLGQRNFVKHFK